MGSRPRLRPQLWIRAAAVAAPAACGQGWRPHAAVQGRARVRVRCTQAGEWGGGGWEHRHISPSQHQQGRARAGWGERPEAPGLSLPSLWQPKRARPAAALWPMCSTLNVALPPPPPKRTVQPGHPNEGICRSPPAAPPPPLRAAWLPPHHLRVAALALASASARRTRACHASSPTAVALSAAMRPVAPPRSPQAAGEHGGCWLRATCTEGTSRSQCYMCPDDDALGLCLCFPKWT